MHLLKNPINMIVSYVSTRRASRDIFGVWVSLDILGDVYVLSHSDAFDQVMIDIDPLEDLDVFSPYKDQRVYSQYG